MKLGIGGFYMEVNTNFGISHKVILMIREEILTKLWKKYKIDKIKPEEVLVILITTKKSKNTLFVEKKNATRYHLWLPFKEIHEASNIYEAFLDNFFEGLKQIFHQFGIPDNELDAIKEDVKSRVIDNTEYNYTDPITQKVYSQTDHRIKK